VVRDERANDTNKIKPTSLQPRQLDSSADMGNRQAEPQTTVACKEASPEIQDKCDQQPEAVSGSVQTELSTVHRVTDAQDCDRDGEPQVLTMEEAIALVDTLDSKPIFSAEVCREYAAAAVVQRQVLLEHNPEAFREIDEVRRGIREQQEAQDQEQEQERIHTDVEQAQDAKGRDVCAEAVVEQPTRSVIAGLPLADPRIFQPRPHYDRGALPRRTLYLGRQREWQPKPQFKSHDRLFRRQVG
jgi:hypothetical protein